MKLKEELEKLKKDPETITEDLIKLCRKWALEMVGENSGLGQLIQESEGAIDIKKEDIDVETGYNQAKAEIRKRINENT